MRISDWSSDVCSSDLDRQAALAAIADGTIDVLASGHDPRGPEEKRLPFADAAPGAADAEHLLALALTLLRDERITVARLFALLSANPAKVLGFEGGTLHEGAQIGRASCRERVWQYV